MVYEFTGTPLKPAKIIWIVAGYVLVAGTYILVSDWLVFLAWPDAGQTRLAGTVKGIGFVLLTAAALFILLHRLASTSQSARQAQTATRVLTTQIPKFFTSIPVVVYVLELRDGRPVPVWVNDNVRTILGYSVDEVLHPDWWARRVHPEDRDAALAASESIMANGQGAHDYRFRHRDGSYRFMHDELKLVRPADGSEPTRIVGTWTDISDRREAEERARRYAERLEQTMLGTVDAISTMLERRDPYTSGHQRRVGDLAAAIAAEMGMDEHQQNGLRIAGALHDVGKISVPSDILSKPARLTPAEYELVKGHAETGYQILKGVDFPWPVAAIAHQHHERMNGSGYPQGLQGTEILPEARIVAIADVVESMASHRPYRAGLGIESALAEIEQQAGTLYDSDAAAACLRLFREKGYTIPQ